MFPANVYAALEGLELGGSLATPLPLQAAMQLFFLTATLAAGSRWRCDVEASRRPARPRAPSHISGGSDLAPNPE
jgi:hypothetical protein